MFGTYRTTLAVMVAIFHLGGLPVLGGYAVFGFYILSGYLMTLIMNNNYGYSMEGGVKFALNRILRIYPIYWVSCIISLLLIFWQGDSYLISYQGNIRIPDDLKSVFKNIFLVFPYPYTSEARLTPPSWALTVELFFYACIGLGLSKSKSITLVWFIVSVLYVLIINILGLGWEYKYFIIPAASLPFSTGAVIFHYRDKFSKIIGSLFGYAYGPYILFILLIINWLLGYQFGTLRSFNFYINYFLCALVIISLLNRTALPFVSKKVDKLLGEFSYPIYLIHYQVGLVVLVFANLSGFSIVRPDYILVCLSLPFIFIAAWVLTRYIELPIEILRKKIKNNFKLAKKGRSN